MNKAAPPSYPGEPSYQPTPPGVYPSINNEGVPTMTQPQPTPVYVTTSPTSQPTIMVVGGCPTCRAGILQDTYGCLPICLAICFFPIGILCCYMMRERQCTNCGSVFSA